MLNLLLPIATPPLARATNDRLARPSPAVRSDSVYVVFTSADDTMTAARVARDLAAALKAPLTLVHVRSVPFALAVDEPASISPLETMGFAERLRSEGVDARVRVYLCRNARRMLPWAFKPRSLIVMAGRHRWWPTEAERWRRALEAGGHAVVFVDTAGHSSHSPELQEASRA